MLRRQPRSNYELKKLSDIWLDMAKYIFLSFVIKLIDPLSTKLTIGPILFLSLVIGLLSALFCVNISLSFAKRVKE